jgi:DNA polymerase elongation subunit (family B)
MYNYSKISQELHNTVIDYDDMSRILPERYAFLDENLYKTVSQQIKNNDDILFMPNDLTDNINMQESKYAKSKYKIVLYGIFEDGRKSAIIINNINPYFEIKIPEDQDPEQFGEYIFDNLYMEGQNDYKSFLKIINVNEKNNRENYFKIEPTKYKIVEGKPFRYYQEHTSKYLQIYFDKLSHRKDAILWARAKNYETSHDDLSCYYRVVCRDYLLSFSSWLKLSNYSKDSNKYIKGNVYNINIEDINVYNEIDNRPHIQKDNLMTMCWDIETYNADKDGKIPMPEYTNHKIFMIGLTFQWHNSSEQLLRICLVDYPSNPHPDFLTIICHNEKNLIKAFSKCANKLNPDIIMGFNDSNYDWPWIINRAKSYSGVLKYISNQFTNIISLKEEDEKKILYNYKAINVKIEADVSVRGNNFQMPGYIPIDTMIVFRQLYPTSEKWSLNFFLEQNKLGGKKDMPYQDMFDIYENMSKHMELINNGKNEKDEKEFNILKDKMKLIAEYCIIDSQRCHELLKIRSVIQDKREISNLSFTSMFDAFYTANGMKVRNLVIARANIRNLKLSNISHNNIENGKYPGAYVFPPIKGLLTSKLNIDECVKKAKLGYKKYQSWINISDQDINKCKDFISNNGCFDLLLKDDSKKQLETLPDCMNQFLNQPTGRPITGLDFSSLYPSLMMCYNLSPEYMIVDKSIAKNMNKKHNLYKIKFPFNGRMIRGWSVRHDNKLDQNNPDFKFGLFPSILKELFDTRSQLKKSKNGLAFWEHKIEQLKLLSNDELLERKEEYEEALFQFSKIDSKQKALKVFMNTFYGEAGNKRSSLFMLQIAGGITTAGQYNIKSAYKYVVEQGCKVYYGDSDSLYITMPEKAFESLDKKFYSALIDKTEYWEEMVKITFDEVKIIRDGINKWFISDNGTEFLKMAYEEVLFPVLFAAKKKYVGIPHISKPNFTIDDNHPLFVRGLALKTRGVADILKDICNDILKRSMEIDNILTIKELVQEKITETYNKKWDENDFDKFIMTDVYKPYKQNVKMHVFYDRMLKERNIKLRPGERNKYVVVKKYPYYFDERGRKVPLKVGDMMELAEIAKSENMQIDLDYYMNKKINGQLARFITYHRDFQVEIKNYDDEDEVKKAELKILNNARKYVDAYCSQYYTQYINKGSIYKDIFKITSKLVHNKLLNNFDESNSTHNTIKLLTYSVDIEKEEFDNWIKERITKDVEKKQYNKDYGKKYIEYLIKGLDNKQKNEKIEVLQRIYYARKNNLLKESEKLYNDRQLILEQRLQKSLEDIRNLYRLNNTIVCSLNDYIKNIININNEYNISIEENKSESKLPSLEKLKEIKNIDNKHFNNELDNLIDNNIEQNKEILKKGIKEFKFIYINLISNYEYIYQIRSIVNYLKALRDKKTGIIKTPPKKEITNIVQNLIDESVNEFLQEYRYI